MTRTAWWVLACALCGACKQSPPALPAKARCPERMVLLPDLGVCIDRFEARVVVEGGESRAEPAKATLPDADLTWVQAEEACRHSGLRLCTGREWTRACAGPSGQRQRPYGDAYVSHRCNISELNDPSDSLRLAPGGQNADCASPEGAFDLLGNALEWTDEARGSLRELRGSGFTHPGPSARCVKDERGFLAMDQAGGGFRCCLTAP